MGLLINVELNNGITVNQAYARISEMKVNKESSELYLRYYLNQETYLSGKNELRQDYFSFNPDISDGSENLWKQAYIYLKYLPEFSGAIDA